MRTEVVTRTVKRSFGREAPATMDVYRMWLDSPQDVAENIRDAIKRHGSARYDEGTPSYRKFTNVRDVSQALDMLNHGWHDKLAETLEIAQSAITTVKAMHEMTTYTRKMAVVGKRADIGRYRAGIPECMVQMRPSSIAKTGRIVTIVASIAYSAAMGDATIQRRGQVATALAMALQELGYATELWVEFTVGDNEVNGRRKAVSVRRLVKGVHDVVDPECILFAFAHNASARSLTFPFVNDARLEKDKAPGWCNGSLGAILEPIEDMPEGTIYLPSAIGIGDSEDVAQNVTRHLRNLGIIAD